MGLFNFFKQNQPPVTPPPNGNVQGNESPDIPKEIFIEDKEPQERAKILNGNGEAIGIEAVYTFLQADYETRGYSDALTNPDDSTKTDGIKLIKLDLQILIERVNNYYEKRIQDFDLHISSRGRAGLIDLVEELKSEKEKEVSDLEKIKSIESDIESAKGLVERITLSYQKGFMRGLSALTESKVLK